MKSRNYSLQWWPGVVAEPVKDADSEIRRSADGNIVYNIDYEAFDEFAAERCQITFLTHRTQSYLKPYVGSLLVWSRHSKLSYVMTL
jgi:hypothetical protein